MTGETERAREEKESVRGCARGEPTTTPGAEDGDEDGARRTVVQASHALSRCESTGGASNRRVITADRVAPIFKERAAILGHVIVRWIPISGEETERGVRVTKIEEFRRQVCHVDDAARDGGTAVRRERKVRTRRARIEHECD